MALSVTSRDACLVSRWRCPLTCVPLFCHRGPLSVVSCDACLATRWRCLSPLAMLAVSGDCRPRWRHELRETRDGNAVESAALLGLRTSHPSPDPPNPPPPSRPRPLPHRNPLSSTQTHRERGRYRCLLKGFSQYFNRKKCYDETKTCHNYWIVFLANSHLNDLSFQYICYHLL